MTDEQGDDSSERDPEATLEEWKASMRAEHEAAIADPDPDADHRIRGVAQVNYRIHYEYDPDASELVKRSEEQVGERSEPELLSCSCGVRGMSREEARKHTAAAREKSSPHRE